MRQEQATIFGRLGKMLRANYEDIKHAPLPQRWVDLILYLDEQERKSAQRGATTRSKARGNPMINAAQIKEHMEVKGSDGKHVGTVLGVKNGRLKLASGGMDHDIDIGMVGAIKNDTVHLRKTAEEMVRSWH